MTIFNIALALLFKVLSKEIIEVSGSIINRYANFSRYLPHLFIAFQILSIYYRRVLLCFIPLLIGLSYMYGYLKMFLN